MLSDEPIFIVGVPRSGTTLLASILSAHGRLACGPETAFFASLAAGEPLLRPGDWPGAAISFAESTRLEGESLLERYDVSRQELRGLLADAEPDPVGVLKALGEVTARRAGKARWMEKSPVHLLYVRQIRWWFPLAPIVRIVRDPRDVALSLTRVPWGPGDLIGGLLYWRRFHERSRSFFESDPISFTVRYEDLVERPKETLRQVCSFLGEEPEPGMLAGSRPTGGLVRESESWKGNVGCAVDPSRSGGWRELPATERELADAVAGDLLRELDYPLAEARLDDGWIWLHPATEVAAGAGELRRHLEAGRRLWPLAAGESPRAGLLVGDPDADDWLGRDSWQRVRAVLAILRRVAGLRLRGKRVTWSRPESRLGRRGLSGGLLSAALRRLTVEGASEG